MMAISAEGLFFLLVSSLLPQARLNAICQMLKAPFSPKLTARCNLPQESAKKNTRTGVLITNHQPLTTPAVLYFLLWMIDFFHIISFSGVHYDHF
jgi:hypothetical protein